jgi:RNA polymerase sigma factor for flagellar operon FliA
MKHDHAAIAAATKAYREDPMDRIRKFMPLLRRLAWNMHGAGSSEIEVEDLVQTGLVALTECISRHQNESDDGFAAYVKVRVKGAMIDLLRRNATISRGAMERRREMRANERALQLEFGRQPTHPELAARMGISEGELAATRVAATPLRFDKLEECYSDSDPAFADDEPDSFDRLCDAEASTYLSEAIHTLGSRHQLVIQLYFVEELNLSEIANILDVSIPRAHQIKAQALAELRATLKGKGMHIDMDHFE